MHAVTTNSNAIPGLYADTAGSYLKPLIGLPLIGLRLYGNASATNTNTIPGLYGNAGATNTNTIPGLYADTAGSYLKPLACLHLDGNAVFINNNPFSRIGF
nr:hypothetical protein 4p_00115 [Serratia proteamaculans]